MRIIWKVILIQSIQIQASGDRNDEQKLEENWKHWKSLKPKRSRLKNNSTGKYREWIVRTYKPELQAEMTAERAQVHKQIVFTGGNKHKDQTRKVEAVRAGRTITTEGNRMLWS